MPSVVIPDIHGCPEYLDWALERFPGRHFIQLGDLIHRGSDSRRALQLALTLAEEGRMTLLWGNHEHWDWTKLSRLPEQKWLHWLKHHGWDDSVYTSYGGTAEGAAQFMADLHHFQSLARPYVVEGDMLCAHAARPSLSEDEEPLDLGYLRDRPVMGLHPLPVHLYPDVRYSVHGHTIMPAPVVNLGADAPHGEGYVYLDLGGARTGKFCVWDAETKEIVFCPSEVHFDQYRFEPQREG